MKPIIVVLAAAVAAVVAPVDASAVDATVRAVATYSASQVDTTTITAAEAMELGAQATGIGPGSHLFSTSDADPMVTMLCTANFIWGDDDSSRLYLGAAGHCFMPSSRTATHGVDADYEPAFTQVEVCVAECAYGGHASLAFRGKTVELGPLAYARLRKETVAETEIADDIGYDFGIVEIPTELHGLVRRSMPMFGGPVTADAELAAGDVTCHYGNAIVLGEVHPTMGRVGVGLVEDDLGEDGAFFAAAPAAPGDSGAAFQTCRRDESGFVGVAAIGLLTHITTQGVAGTTVERAIELAHEAGLSLRPQLEA